MFSRPIMWLCNHVTYSEIRWKLRVLKAVCLAYGMMMAYNAKGVIPALSLPDFFTDDQKF